MNWDERTATAREFLIIQNRKASAFYAMGPDYFANTPGRFAEFMADSIVYLSEMPPMRLEGLRAVMDFLSEENRFYSRIGHSAETFMAEGEKGENLRLIRERGREEGALIDLVLDENGMVTEVHRFSEKKEKYRASPGGGLSLYPARIERDAEGNGQYIDKKEDEIFITGIYRSEMELLFELVGEVYEEMEDRRYMDMRDWVAMADIWKKINEAEDPEPLKEELFRPLQPLFEDHRHYRTTMDTMFWDVWDGRDEYTRRMQQRLEEYVYAYRDGWDLMNKF